MLSSSRQRRLRYWISGGYTACRRPCPRSCLRWYCPCYTSLSVSPWFGLKQDCLLQRHSSLHHNCFTASWDWDRHGGYHKFHNYFISYGSQRFRSGYEDELPLSLPYACYCCLYVERALLKGSASRPSLAIDHLQERWTRCYHLIWLDCPRGWARRAYLNSPWLLMARNHY